MAILNNNGGINHSNSNNNSTISNNRERANINNANNIRNVANIATASHNPYAKAAGLGVKALDKATGGKSTDALGKLASRTTKMMPGGKRVQNASNKLSESGVSDKLGKAANFKNKLSGRKTPNDPNNKLGNGPTKTSPNNDIGSKNLQKSKFNRAKNIINNRRRKRSASSDESNGSTDSGSTEDRFKTDDLVSKAMKKIRIKIIISLVAAILFIAFFILIFMSILGVNVQLIIPAAGNSSYGTSEFNSVYEKGTKEYDNEIKYYKALQKASSNYSKENGEPLKTNYIHSVLIYVYYQIDEKDETNLNQDELEDEIAIDYAKMTEKIDDIVELMKPSNSKKNIDYEKNGEFYNNLKNSVEFKKYYSNILKEKSIDDLLDEIFDLAAELDSISYDDDTVITNETQVKVASSNSSVSMKEYLADSIYANNQVNDSEKVKALTVAYSTNIVSKNKTLTVNSTTATASNDVCSVKFGCSYDKNGNLVTGAGEKSSKNTINFGGKYYYKKPLTSSEVSTLNNNIKSVYGSVLVNSDGTYPIVDTNVLNGLGDDNYKELLKDAYGNYNIKDVGEDSYITDGSYGDSKVFTNVIFYDQNDYRNTTFCGIKGENIKTSGCGTTAMSIVVSTYENSNKYDPVYMMKKAHSSGYCGTGISGTSPGFFKKEANSMNYKYLRTSKRKKSDLNLILKHLSQGHLVITHMKSGHFTSGGHYMVLGGVDPNTKKVYVYDPNNSSNSKYRKTGNGWYSFNDIIVKESFNYFYIIWKG